MQRIKRLSERDLKSGCLASMSLVDELETTPYGQLAALFVNATSPSLSGQNGDEGASSHPLAFSLVRLTIFV
jgi:hypothetical protein